MLIDHQKKLLNKNKIAATQKRNGNAPYLFTLLFLLLLAMFIASFLLWMHFIKINKVLEITNRNTSTYEKIYKNDNQNILPLSNTPAKTSSSMLPILVLQNAVERYKELNGGLPPNSSSLASPHPNNYLSFIPDQTSYQKTNNGYKITNKLDDKPLYDNELLSLHFYPETNQLALQRGLEVLSLFSVASGKSLLPPANSEITERVVGPLGKNGAYGTRGLALTNGFAIHGTNNESSVGKRVSEGCLRMHKTDIEQLFPYVSLGTPFSVDNGVPSSPTFSALPSLSSKSEQLNDMSNQLNDWKN